jgi:hypothetical protein
MDKAGEVRTAHNSEAEGECEPTSSADSLPRDPNATDPPHSPHSNAKRFYDWFAPKLDERKNTLGHLTAFYPHLDGLNYIAHSVYNGQGIYVGLYFTCFIYCLPLVRPIDFRASM